MALTNDQITAQNFKDFYGQIRPYLNGNVPTFANTFNKSDLYSTDEILIGRWIDGKPIYQRVFNNGDIVISNTAWTDLGISIAANDIDHIIKSFGISSGSSNDDCMFWFHTHSEDSVSNVHALAPRYNGALKVRYIVLQYTKKNNSTISISDGNEYSTDEQIVGHWIDGELIYQKTFTGTKIANTNTVIGVLPSNYNTVIDISGTTKYNSEKGYLPVTYAYASNDLQSVYINGTGNVTVTGTYGGPVHITVKYTKV